MGEGALLVIDMQRGVMQKDVYKANTLIKNINMLAEAFREHNHQVIFIRHTNTSSLKVGSDEWMLSDALNITDKDIIFDKHFSSVFKEKSFLPLLKQNDIATLVIAGLVSNGCVQAACLDGKKAAFNVILINDAHSTFSKDPEKVISDWNNKLEVEGIKVISTEEFLQ